MPFSARLRCLASSNQPHLPIVYSIFLSISGLVHGLGQNPYGWILSEDYHRHAGGLFYLIQSTGKSITYKCNWIWKFRVDSRVLTVITLCGADLHVHISIRHPLCSRQVIILPAWPFPTDPQLNTPKSDSKAPSSKPAPLLLSPSQEVHFSVPWVYDLGAICDPMHSQLSIFNPWTSLELACPSKPLSSPTWTPT